MLLLAQMPSASHTLVQDSKPYLVVLQRGAAEFYPETTNAYPSSHARERRIGTNLVRRHATRSQGAVLGE